MRYWKGGYDEDGERDRELRQLAGFSAGDDEHREMWVFRLLVAMQLLLVTLAALLFVTAR